MKRPACGGAKLFRDTRDIQYVYKSATTTIPAVRGGFAWPVGNACWRERRDQAPLALVKLLMLLNRPGLLREVHPGQEQ